MFLAGQGPFRAGARAKQRLKTVRVNPLLLTLPLGLRPAVTFGDGALCVSIAGGAPGTFCASTQLSAWACGTPLGSSPTQRMASSATHAAFTLQDPSGGHSQRIDFQALPFHASVSPAPEGLHVHATSEKHQVRTGRQEQDNPRSSTF